MTIKKLEKYTWYGEAHKEKIRIDGDYSIRVQRYDGSTAGYTTIFSIEKIKGFYLLEQIQMLKDFYHHQHKDIQFKEL